MPWREQSRKEVLDNGARRRGASAGRPHWQGPPPVAAHPLPALVMTRYGQDDPTQTQCGFAAPSLSGPALCFFLKKCPYNFQGLEML
jgi:hypothetical protein